MLGSGVRFSMNDIRKTAPNPLPRQWSLTAVTLLILGIALGQYIPAASIIGGGMLITGPNCMFWLAVASPVSAMWSRPCLSGDGYYAWRQC